ncbi:MAG: hypothetical protein ACI4UM_00045 [Succinivibrio sp.]
MGLNRRAILVEDKGYGSVKNIHKLYQDNQKFEYMLCKGIRVLLSDFISDPVEASRAYCAI